MRLARGLPAWGLAGLLLGCAAGGGRSVADNYHPDRRDYATFRAGHPEVLEPNYLPFMVHRIPGDAADGDALVLCRWSAADMPLPVYIVTPEIPEELQDEFAPKDPAAYVRAVEAALAMWERDLEGLVRFRRVARASEAKLVLELIADRAPVPEQRVKVLGSTPVAGACVARGRVSGALELDVRFSVPNADIYLADEFGLLGAEQVQWIALHEIGHALGMRRHSPIPADLMYEVVRDRILVRGLSVQDINSFVSLYQLRNGTVFGHVAPDVAPDVDLEAAPEPALLPHGPPQLAMAPFVDARLGFQVNPPAGWLRLETARGMVAVDGLTWDYSASFQVIVERYASIEEYLDRFGNHYLGRGSLLGWEFTEFAGYRTLEASIVTHDESSTEQFLFVEVGDGRLFVILMDCSTAAAEAYWPWFHAALGSLEIWTEPARATPR